MSCMLYARLNTLQNSNQELLICHAAQCSLSKPRQSLSLRNTFQPLNAITNSNQQACKKQADDSAEQ